MPKYGWYHRDEILWFHWSLGGDYVESVHSSCSYIKPVLQLIQMLIMWTNNYCYRLPMADIIIHLIIYEHCSNKYISQSTMYTISS